MGYSQKTLNHQKPTNINKLKTLSQREWRSITLEMAKSLVYSMPKRIEATPPRAQGLLTEVWQRRKRQK